MAAKQLLTGGIRWRVGDGTKIKILDQPWLLTNHNPYITSDPEPLQGSLVASLFCMDKKDWDLEVVSDMLNERDQACVLTVQLSESNHNDKFYWCLEDSGIYSVKSTY